MPKGSLKASGVGNQAGPIAQLVQSARLISVRSVVQIHLGPPSSDELLDGAVAQLVERQLCKLDVVGSIPISSTEIFGTGN